MKMITKIPREINNLGSRTGKRDRQQVNNRITSNVDFSVTVETRFRCLTAASEKPRDKLRGEVALLVG